MLMKGWNEVLILLLGRNKSFKTPFLNVWKEHFTQGCCCVLFPIFKNRQFKNEHCCAFNMSFCSSFHWFFSLSHYNWKEEFSILFTWIKYYASMSSWFEKFCINKCKRIYFESWLDLRNVCNFIWDLSNYVLKLCDFSRSSLTSSMFAVGCHSTGIWHSRIRKSKQSI